MAEDASLAPRVAVIGAAFSANKGAASMLYAVLDVVGRRHPGAEFDVLTTYPKADAKEVERSSALGSLDARDVRIVNLSPKALVMAVIAAVFVRIGQVLHLPTSLIQTSAIRSLVRADIVIDVAGISFVDGRGIPLLGYNTLMTGLPLLLGRPTVKASQALGPFEKRGTRFAARLVLPRLEGIGARGAVTRGHLDDLGLTNAFDAADLAFSMDLVEGMCADDLPTDRPGVAIQVVVMPSSVVQRYCDEIEVDYLGIMAEAIDVLTERHECSVTLAPHSFRANGEESRMNDGPTVAGIAERLTRPDSVSVVSEGLDPRCLRDVISRGDVLITSRFHAMISALATSTPVVVVGWSHKYAEVLDQFDVPECAIAYGDLTTDAVLDVFESIVDQRDQVSARIAANLDEVVESSLRSFDKVDEVLEERR